MRGRAWSHTSIALNNYLVDLEKAFRDEFDPIRALDDLIGGAQILKKMLE